MNIMMQMNELNKAATWMHFNGTVGGLTDDATKARWCCKDAVQLAAQVHQMLRQLMRQTLS